LIDLIKPDGDPARPWEDFWTEATVVRVAMGPFLFPSAIMRAPWRMA
jgi:hypothetical protein